MTSINIVSLVVGVPILIGLILIMISDWKADHAEGKNKPPTQP